MSFLIEGKEYKHMRDYWKEYKENKKKSKEEKEE